MIRQFKIARRRPNYVDFYTPIQAGVDGYKLSWATNFDATPTDFLTSTNVGFLDPKVNQAKVDTQPIGGMVRIVFDPATYSITDTSSFWLIFTPMTGVVAGTASPPTLILPDSSNHGVGIVTIQGSAPSATSSAGSLQIDFPYLMQDFRIHSEDATNYLYVATEAGGAEQQIRPDTFPQYTNILGTQASIFVRGATSSNTGASVKFSATCTLAFPR